MAYEHERDEWRAAVRADRGPAFCHEHNWQPHRQGGGTCAKCGLTLDREEL